LKKSFFEIKTLERRLHCIDPIEFKNLKGLIAYFQVAHHSKMAMLDLQQCPGNLYLIKMWKITLFFLIISPVFLMSKKCVCHFCREYTNENEPFSKVLLDQTKLFTVP